MRPADRLFRIIQLMRATGRAMTAREIAEKMEVAQRTIYRDMEHLIASGAPIDGERGVGYLLRGAFDAPPLAFTFEQLCSGLGSGAFSVLLLRMTQKRFSATQYALFSSLFGLPRIISGPIAGFAAYSVGWAAFFWSTLPLGIPGMIMLARFVPWNAREVEFRVEPPRIRQPLTGRQLAARGLGGAGAGFVSAALIMAFLDALRAMKDDPATAFDLWTPLLAVGRPEDSAGWITLAGLLVFAAVCGLFTAAVVAARHGAGRTLAEDVAPQAGEQA